VRVGLNLLYLVPGQVGGSEVYARELVSALARERPDLELVVFCGQEAVPALAREGWPARVRLWPLRVRSAVKPLRIGVELGLLPGAAARARVDLLHSLGTTSPMWTPCPRVVTVLDLIYEHFPETFPTAARLGLRAVVGPAARRADRVLAISGAGGRDVTERLRLDPGRVDVVPIGFGRGRRAAPTPEPELRARLGLGDGRVVLCVSAALAHKNLPRLVRAVAALGEDAADVRLVVAGHAGREHDALTALAGAEGVGERVVLTGWIADEDLEGLYALATCAVYPSLHEGFGLPVLEAMARDVPIACADATALPEVAGDAAELFDPLRVDAIASALRRLLDDPARRAELVSRGRERVPRFTWEACARGTLASYERALSGRSERTKSRSWGDSSSTRP
jgi:glycosyltransferase involved in cell wall biosynthesis